MGEDAAPSATPSTSEALSDLKSDLTTKLAELKQAQDKVAEETHKSSALQDEVKLLQAKLMDVQRSVNNYEPLSTAMRIRLKEARKLTSQKADIAEAAIDKEEKLIIDKKTVEFEQALSDQAKMVQYEHSVAEAAKKAANSAEEALLHKQTQYADLKNKPKIVDAQLTEIAGLLDQINKAEGLCDYVSVYVLASEAKSLTLRIDIPTVTDFSNLLMTAQAEVETAKSDAAEKKAHAEQLSAALTNLKQRYETALASRRTDLLSVLKTAEARAA